MTKTVLNGSRNKSYAEQQQIVKAFSEKAKALYQVPRAIEAAVSVFMRYIVTGERLLNDDPWTYTRCQEKYREWQLVVGGFAPAGLIVDHPL